MLPASGINVIGKVGPMRAAGSGTRELRGFEQNGRAERDPFYVPRSAASLR